MDVDGSECASPSNPHQSGDVTKMSSSGSTPIGEELDQSAFKLLLEKSIKERLDRDLLAERGRLALLLSSNQTKLDSSIQKQLEFALAAISNHLTAQALMTDEEAFAMLRRTYTARSNRLPRWRKYIFAVIAANRFRTHKKKADGGQFGGQRVAKMDAPIIPDERATIAGKKILIRPRNNAS